MPYATLDDVYQLGLGAQAFASRPRPVQSGVDGGTLDITTGVIRLEAHGLDAADLVSLRVSGGGALPTGAPSLSAFTVYSPDVVSFDLFRLRNPAGGAPITSYTTAGSGWSVAVDPRRRLERHLADTAAQIDDKLTAHAPPIEVDPSTGGYPPIVVGLNARLAALAAATSLQFDNAVSREAVDRLQAQVERDWQNLATYLAGRPINPRPTDQTDIADNGARATASAPVVWEIGYL